MNDIMLDLETMGNGPSAAIIAIGAVEFNTEAQIIGESFYINIDLASAVDEGGIMDASTVLWWMQQSEEAREPFKVGGVGIDLALSLFAQWMAERSVPDNVKMWGNGAAFDNVILATAYQRLGMPPPWRYWNDRCYRTVKSIYPTIKMERTGTHHNAVDDAKSQAQHLIQIYQQKSVRHDQP